MVLSLSSDGNYVISSDLSQHVVLWNIKKRTYKIIASHANIYSVYFVKHSHDFIYQSNKSNKVFVVDINGRILKTFRMPFPTYGEVMTSNLKHYFAADQNFNVYQRKLNKLQKIHLYYCYQDHHGKKLSWKNDA